MLSLFFLSLFFSSSSFLASHYILCERVIEPRGEDTAEDTRRRRMEQPNRSTESSTRPLWFGVSRLRRVACLPAASEAGMVHGFTPKEDAEHGCSLGEEGCRERKFMLA